MKVIKDKLTKDFVLNFWERINLEQSKSKDQETIIYSPITIYYAVIKKIFFIDFVFHPILMKKRKYFEEAKIIEDDEELLNSINKVLEYELTYELDDGISYLSNTERDDLIKFHKKLQKKIQKKYANV